LVFAVHADTYAAEPKPKIDMASAIERASKFALGKIDFKDYYMDRVWITRLKGENERRWAISWSPDASNDAKKLGWYIVVVDMEGNAQEASGSVVWLTKKLVQEPIKNVDPKGGKK
jgi:hypothetical protein